MKLASIYARVSTEKQEKQKTIKSQIAELEEYAKENDYTIVRKYIDDGWSGTMLARPKLDKLRDDAKKGIWEAVLIYDRDRLARKLAYQEFVIDELRENNIEIVFLNEPLAEDAEGRILQQIKGVFADYERIKTAERMRRGKIHKAKNGHVVTGQAPYGYKYIPKQGDKHGYYEINPYEAEVVKMIFQWVADEGLTMRQIVRKLKELKIPPRRSKRGVWSTSTLTTLLRREDYIGTSYYNKSRAVVPETPLKDKKYKKVKKTSRKPKPKKEWVAISVPAIIDKELFDRARKQLEANYRLCKRNRKNNYLLARKIKCVCGNTRSGEGTGDGKHLYYRCTDRVRSFPLPSECKERGINAKIADKLVWDKVSDLMTSPQLIKKQIRKWMQQNQKKSDYSEESIEGLKAELGRLESEEKRYIKAFGGGVIESKQLKEVMGELGEKKESLKLQIEEYNSKIRDNSFEIPSEEEVERFSELCREEIGNLSFEAKRGILLKVLDKVIGTQEELVVRGFLPVQETSHVEFHSKDRDSGFTKCGKINSF